MPSTRSSRCGSGTVTFFVVQTVAAEPDLQTQWDAIPGRFIDVGCQHRTRQSCRRAIDGPPARSLAVALMWMGERNLR